MTVPRIMRGAAFGAMLALVVVNAQAQHAPSAKVATASPSGASGAARQLTLRTSHGLATSTACSSAA